MDVNPAIAAAQRRDARAALRTQLRAGRITQAEYDEAMERLEAEVREEK